MKEKLAIFISHLFDPTLIFPIFLLFLVLRSGLTPTQTRLLLPSLFLVDLVFPGIYFAFAFKKGFISDWEMSRREERLLPYGVVLLFWGVGLILVRLFGNDFLFKLGLTLYLIGMAGAVTTLFWKISVHAAANTAFALILNFLYHWQLPWLYLIIPLVSWARWQRKKHTIPQLLAGFLLSLLVIFSSFAFFGYL